MVSLEKKKIIIVILRICSISKLSWFGRLIQICKIISLSDECNEDEAVIDVL